MSRYESASHVFYRCQYHIVWTPKYRYKILKGKVGKELYRSIYVFCSMKKCTVVELNVQIDHVHLVVRTPPSLSVSDLMGTFVDWHQYGASSFALNGATILAANGATLFAP